MQYPYRTLFPRFGRVYSVYHIPLFKILVITYFMLSLSLTLSHSLSLSLTHSLFLSSVCPSIYLSFSFPSFPLSLPLTNMHTIALAERSSVQNHKLPDFLGKQPTWVVLTLVELAHQVMAVREEEQETDQQKRA